MSDPKGRGRPQKYPWDEWGDGELHVAIQGDDFDCTLESFRALVHRTAREKYSVTASTELDRRNKKLVFRIKREEA